MSIYLKLPNIRGDVQTKGYEGWIELTEAEFCGIHTPTKMTVGKVMDRFNTHPAFSQVVLGKVMDQSSPQLFEAAHSVSVFPQAEIHYVQTGSQLFSYARMVLSNVAVTHYSEAYNSDTGLPEELIRMAYTKIERTFTPRGRDNKAGSPIITGYNLEQAEKL